MSHQCRVKGIRNESTCSSIGATVGIDREIQTKTTKKKEVLFMVSMLKVLVLKKLWY